MSWSSFHSKNRIFHSPLALAVATKRLGVVGKIRLGWIGLIPLVLGWGVCLAGESVMQGLEHETQAIFSRAKDSVVQIKAIVPLTEAAKGEEASEGLSVGSGFFADNQGHVLTAASVLHGEKEALIFWRGKKYEAQCLGQDDRAKVALLKIEKIDVPTPFLKEGDPEALKVGSMTLVVGFPFEGSPSAEYGQVSEPDSVQVEIPQPPPHNDIRFSVPHIRSNIRVHPGQSGSPLLNTKGEVVGMVVYAMEDGSSTFALPITAVRKVQRDLAQFHAPRYGWTGIMHEFTLNDLKNTGRPVSVRGVYQGSPGHVAGIRAGDVLKKIGGKDILTSADLMTATFYLPIGETVKFTIERDGESQTLPVKVAPRPSDNEFLGLKPILSPSSGIH